MGFDINCIIDVHTCPREYFCPVCRNLVEPNDAFKSPCSHLFCISCFTCIANGSKVCPYDGCLVTQSDSKPLIDSDKVLLENISKVRVRCLYVMSGCKWEGTLADCRCHSASCSFGNSHVTCNGCGIQVLHCQMHDHTCHCPAMLGAQGSVRVPSGSTVSVTISSTATAAVSQLATQSGASLPGVQNPPTFTSLVLAPNYNMPFTANSQAPVVAPVTMLDPYQWSQPQYLRYYPSCMGYGPYAVPPLQRQPLMQPHPQLQHPQTQSLAHPLPISELRPQAQAPPQMPGQESVSTQNLANPHPSQMLHQLLPQIRPQAQAPPQIQSQGSAPTEVFTSNPVNPQPPLILHQLLPKLRPQTQAPPQRHGQGSMPTQSFSQNLSNLQPPLQPAYALPQYQFISQPPPSTQHSQLPQYQQSKEQIYHHQVSQANAQSQPPPQAQHHIQFSNRPHVVQSQMQPYVACSQVSQVRPVDGHQQSLGMRPGVSQQHHVPLHLTNVPLHTIQQRGQIQEHRASVQHPHYQATLPSLQPLTLLPPNKVPSIMLPSHQQLSTHGQPSNLHFVMRPLEQVVHQQCWRPIIPQRPLQTQTYPFVLSQWGQSQNSFWRPMITNQRMHPQSHPVSSGVAPLAHSGSSQSPSTPICGDHSYARSSSEQAGMIEGTSGSSRELTEKGILKEEEATGQNDIAVKLDVQGSVKNPPGGKSLEAVAKLEELYKETGTEEGSVYYASHPKNSQEQVQEQSQLVGPQVSGLAATTRTDPHGLVGRPFPIHVGDHVVYPTPGFMNAGSSAGGMDLSDSRKIKSFGSGWCGICKVDCNSIEGLQLHSQSNEHHTMAKDKAKTFNPKDENLQGTEDDV